MLLTNVKISFINATTPGGVLFLCVRKYIENVFFLRSLEAVTGATVIFVLIELFFFFYMFSIMS